MADLSFLDPQTTGEPQTESPLEAASPDLSFLDPGTSAQPSGPNPLIQARDLTSGMDPVKTAKVIDLSRKTGLPARVVEPNMPDLERQQVLSDQKLDTVHQLYPGTARFLSDPDAFAVAQHDIDGLTMLEGTISQYNPGVMERLSQKWGESTEQLEDSLRGFVMGSLQTFLDTSAPEVADGSDWDSGLGRMIRGIAQDALTYVQGFHEQQKKGRSAPLLPADNVVQQYAEDFIGAAAPILATIGISAVGSPVAGASFMGTQIAGGDYLSRTEQGADPTTAYLSGLADAALQAPLEAIGLGKFFQIFKTTGMGNVLKAAATAMGTEFVTEFLQKYPEDLTEALALAEPRGQDVWGALGQFADNLDETTVNGLYEGLLSLPWAIVGGAGHMSTEYVKARASEREQAVIDAVTQGVQTSQLAQLDPLMFEQAVALMKQGSAVENVYIPAQAFAQMYSHNIEVRAAAMDSLGITEEQLEAQASTGGDLVIPLEKYAKAVATVPDFAAAIANDRRLTADGYTRNEKAAFDEEMALNMQRAVEVARQEREVKDQFDAETKAIYEEALELRKAAGVVGNAAASDALGMSAAFTNIARMSEGQYTPQQLWEAYKPKVVGPDTVLTESTDTVQPTGEPVDPFDTPGEWATAELDINGTKAPAGDVVNALKQRATEYEKLMGCLQ